jgi:hypothetical protein
VCPSENDEPDRVAEAPPPESLFNRSFRELLGRLADDARALVRQEVELARAELEQKVRAAVGAVAMCVVAAIAAILALGAFTTALILVLARFLPDWAAALVVGGGLLALAVALGFAGKHLLRNALPLAPEETVETLKEDVAWAKTQLKSARR